jgi:hypothetical protein
MQITLELPEDIAKGLAQLRSFAGFPVSKRAYGWTPF